MSFVLDQINAINGHLERLELGGLSLSTKLKAENESIDRNISLNADNVSRVEHLKALIKLISTESISRKSSAKSLLYLLQQAQFSTGAVESSYEHELQWILLGKVAIQTHGIILDSLLTHTLPISDDLWYWGTVIDSYRYTSLYSIQTFPIRLVDWLRNAYNEARDISQPLIDQWRHFYSIVHSVIRETSVAGVGKRMTFPLSLVRNEIRHKQAALKSIKLLHANAIGHLVSMSFSHQSLQDNSVDYSRKAFHSRQNTWRKIVTSSVNVMAAVLKACAIQDVQYEDYDAAVIQMMNEDQSPVDGQSRSDADATGVSRVMVRPMEISHQLRDILNVHLPAFIQEAESQLLVNGRPSRVIRYWLPATSFLIFSGTILRIVLGRRDSIQKWIRECGITIAAFWNNWIVEPSMQLVSTIRHEKGREISITSKHSLEGDRASLERMVVEFAIANPGGPPLQEADINDVKSKLMEGDLTPVLRVYEKEMQSPLLGAVKGNLIQALLIQVQKTKVDIDIAMRGIDSLLRSQELVFGFVSLTPGVLVCLAATRYLSTISDRRRGTEKGTQLSQATLILRNIDRVLTAARRERNSLSFTEQGLVTCEAVKMMEIGGSTLSSDQYRELVSDLEILVDIDCGVKRQRAVAERVHKAVVEWLRR